MPQENNRSDKKEKYESPNGRIFRTMLKVVFVGMGILGLMWGATSMIPERPDSEAQPTAPSRSGTHDSENSNWQQVQRWSGSGEQDLTSDIFRMSASWVLEGNASPEFPNDPAASIFSVLIKRPDGSYVDMVELGLGNNRSYVHESGRFYVEVTAANLDSWRLVARPGS